MVRRGDERGGVCFFYFSFSIENDYYRSNKERGSSKRKRHANGKCCFFFRFIAELFDGKA